MKLFESIASAFASVFANKMRSILTMLGIIIGIGSVIMITAIGGGVQVQTNEQMAQLGLNAIQITMSVDGTPKESDYLKLADAELLKASKNVEYTAPVTSAYGVTNLREPGETKACNITGVTAEYQFAQPVDIVAGRFILDSDVEKRSNVVLIDERLSQKVFGRTDAVGETIAVTIRDSVRELTIIGITKGMEMGPFYDPPAQLYIPITTVMRFQNAEHVNSIYATIFDQGQAKSTINEMSVLLSKQHNNEDSYTIYNMKDQADMLDDIMGYITTFVTLVAAISLVVGGIGVMNIMLVTVTERTREIGIRRAIGARASQIVSQFLIETMVLSLSGGIIGIFVGLFIPWLVTKFAQMPTIVTPSSIILSLGISVSVGIVFGIYPAIRASRLDPIIALRHE